MLIASQTAPIITPSADDIFSNLLKYNTVKITAVKTNTILIIESNKGLFWDLTEKTKTEITKGTSHIKKP